MRTQVIAEVGSTHGGDLLTMKRLIDAAAEVGADAVKMQWLSSAEALCERRNAPEYLDAYRLIQFPAAWLEGLARHAERAGVGFLCTTYLVSDIAVVAPYVSAFKLAAFESRDEAFLDAHLRYDKPLYVSTGMQDHDETEHLAWTLNAAPRGSTLLHCVSAYPTPMDQINLLAMVRFASLVPVGLSDHTTSPLTGALAVALGASVIEFHMRLTDTDPKNADYEVSRTPGWAAVYCGNVRQAELACGGDGHKRVMPCEEPMLRYRVAP